ncbi:ParA family protein [Brucella sp. NBRC 12950]|uniref:ParA family protein n=1 Tax=Brucella sp. NBRC 12950 TaxID=2994518 RepID=UPI0024A4186F|nr:ParA family protein [Brucella sp. NBRC 12950]GLU27317.1 hypothetical protein Brsp01_25500 [Brucella sp. NBRC 12950]
MLKIVLAGQKGGVGKSTISWLLINAALAASDETTALLIETDHQGSSAMYHRRVMQKYPDLHTRFQCKIAHDESSLLAAFEQAEADAIDYIIIDTAGQHEELTRFALSVADRVIIPFRPSVKEYESQLATVTLYIQLRDALQAKGVAAPKAALLLNDWAQNTRLTNRQKTILNTIHEDEMLADFYIPARNGYDTLDQGVIFIRELQEENVVSNPFVRKALQTDLRIAGSTLRSIEALQ